MPKVLSYVDGVDYSFLSEKEMNSKGIRELFSIFYLYDNCGINDVDIGLIARDELKMTGYDGMTLGDIIRGKIYRWNNLFQKGQPRVIIKSKVQGETKGRFYLEPVFAEKVFKNKNNALLSSALTIKIPEQKPFDILDCFDSINCLNSMNSFSQNYITPNSSFGSSASLLEGRSPCILDEPFRTPQEEYFFENDLFPPHIQEQNEFSDNLFAQYLNN